MKLFCRHVYKKTGRSWDYHDIWSWKTNYEYRCIYCGKVKWLDFKGWDKKECKYYKIID